MSSVLHILTLLIVVLAMTPALAHVLELPGKIRLGKEAYFLVQRIYYPGFTIVGASEPLSLLFVIISLFFTPPGSAAFWLRFAALICLAGMQAVYWIFVHSVNKVWLQGESLGGSGSTFFSVGRSPSQGDDLAPNWMRLRNRWEYAHAVRAGLAVLGFIVLLVALSP
jgi:hypothetical protein